MTSKFREWRRTRLVQDQNSSRQPRAFPEPQTTFGDALPSIHQARFYLQQGILLLLDQSQLAVLRGEATTYAFPGKKLPIE